MPSAKRENFRCKLPQRVIVFLVLCLQIQTCFRNSERVIVRFENQLQHVFQYVRSMEVFLLDILALVTCKAFRHWNHQHPTIKGIRFILDAGKFVDTLDNQSEKAIRNRIHVLAIDLDYIMRNNRFQNCCFVDVCTHIVFVHDDRRSVGQWFQHEVLSHVR